MSIPALPTASGVSPALDEPTARVDDHSKPIAQLVDAHLEAAQRLEDDTHGEIDAVTDQQGRTVLLRRSQEHLLARADVPESAILDALPARIAMLDRDGFIVSVNHAWREFAAANSADSTDSTDSTDQASAGIGMNYLASCDAATGLDAADAPRVASAIRSVLSGHRKSVVIEYASHSALAERWFLLSVTPIADDNPSGAVVMHLDITERKKVSRAQRHLAAAMDAMRDAIYLVDRKTMSLIHVNDAACQLHRQSRDELLVWSPWKILDTTRESLERTYDKMIESGVAAEPVEMTRQNDDGSIGWVEVRRHAKRSDGRLTIVTMVRDISERKAAEARIQRLNRMFAMLSSINTLIVRVRERDELFKAACQIALDAGGFRMAWIGIVDRSETLIVPVASAGLEPEFLAVARVRLSLRGEASDKDPISVRAVRSNAAVVVNDIREDSHIFFARKRLAQGIHAMVALPLTIAGEAAGVLTLYAADVGFFDDEEMALLTELAGDIACAIDHIDKQERLDYLAYYDVLTGLANRTLFLERVAQYMRSAAVSAHRLVVFLIDIERFSNINDTFGRAAGDALLNLMAQWITRKVGDVNLLARVGADKFALVLPEVVADGNVTQLVENALAGFLDHPFQVHDTALRIGVKLGAARFPEDGENVETLFRNAEAALKAAKTSGEPYLFYTPAMNEAVVQTMTLENKLRQALKNEEFVLHYQPKINMVSGKLTGAEALIRWNNPETGLVPPGQFIPVLEDTGLIYEVGRWALRQAIADYLRWRAAGFAAVPVSVNVSQLQLRHRHFIKEIEQAVAVDPHAAAGLELEITESVIMADVKRSIATLQAIRALNVTIAIDDFGTGFSSLSYLSKLPVDTLKIDRSFVLDMTSGPQGLALVSTVITLAHSLRLKVVAEGVETDEQRRLLHALNCDEFQGFLFAKPVPVNVFESRFLLALAT